MHEDDGQGDTADTDENVVEHTAQQTIVEHLKIVWAMQPSCKLRV